MQRRRVVAKGRYASQEAPAHADSGPHSACSRAAIADVNERWYEARGPGEPPFKRCQRSTGVRQLGASDPSVF